MGTAVWEQAAQVHRCVSGARWRGRFTTPAPVPGWLVELVDGHMGTYAGHDPVLFRTAGIGLGWFNALHAHRDQLEVTCAHRVLPASVLEHAAHQLAVLGAVVDADVYVWGDGSADGVISARIHRLFGVFSDGATVDAVGRHLEAHSDRFLIGIRVTDGRVMAELAPRVSRMVA